jgi:pimeloyl-ACP methyl ester carboxylesterase
MLKSKWLSALQRGAGALQRQLPPSLDVSFPYYGDVLYRYASALDIPLTEDIQARGDADVDLKFLEFEEEAVNQLRKATGVSDAAVEAEYGDDPAPRGPQNWKWVRALVRALDKHVGGISASFIETFMRDVYLYAYRGGVRNDIDDRVAASFTEEPAIVVAHSLGSVVAYNILRTERRRSLRIPLLVTVGCPLAIRAVRSQFAPIGFPRALVSWSNAFDPRDIVALFPLDSANFPVNPAIINYDNVNNHTDNRHGIDGYLDDPTVSKWILDALGW